jgi:hypothetical protein
MAKSSAITREMIEAAATAIANARGGRQGAPEIRNVLAILPQKLKDEVLEDAEAALTAALSRQEDASRDDALTAGIKAGIEAAIRGIDATILNMGSECDRRGGQDPETGEVPCDGEEEIGCACSVAMELGDRLIKNLRTCDIAKIAALATGGARG